MSTNITLSTIAMITVVGVVAAGSLVSPMLAAEGQTASPKKTTDCHRPPGNPDNDQTITTSAPSDPAHVRNHGDTIGPCLPP
jgi:hypothetical protein